MKEEMRCREPVKQQEEKEEGEKPWLKSFMDVGVSEEGEQ